MTLVTSTDLQVARPGFRTVAVSISNSRQHFGLWLSVGTANNAVPRESGGTWKNAPGLLFQDPEQIAVFIGPDIPPCHGFRAGGQDFQALVLKQGAVACDQAPDRSENPVFRVAVGAVDTAPKGADICTELLCLVKNRRVYKV